MKGPRVLSARKPEGVTTYFNINDLYLLHPIHDMEEHESIMMSIQEEGLLNPPVVCWLTGKEWESMALLSDIRPPPMHVLERPEDKYPVVMCGNNRVRAARTLGYKTVECLALTNRRKVSYVCGTQRRSWKQGTQE